MAARHRHPDAELDGTLGSEAPARRTSDPRRPEHQRVLELQRLAGNVATTNLLHVQRDDPKQARQGGAQEAKPGDPEAAWEGRLATSLSQKKNLYHTLNNFGDQPLSYLFKVENTGEAMVVLGTQFEYQRRRGAMDDDESLSIEDIGRRAGRRRRLPELGSSTRQEREWFAFGVTQGRTEQTTYGLPPHSSLHLRLFGDVDHTNKEASYVAGTLQVRRIK